MKMVGCKALLMLVSCATMLQLTKAARYYDSRYEEGGTQNYDKRYEDDSRYEEGGTQKIDKRYEDFEVNGTATMSQLTEEERYYDKRYEDVEADGTEYETYQPGKYWPSSQCPYLGGTFAVVSLHACIQSCNKNPQCTAIHYKSSDKRCELKFCPIPAPQPSGTYAGWRGYSLDSVKVDGAEYDAYELGKYWPSSQCPYLGSHFTVVSLDSCMQSCTKNPSCTAVHFRPSTKGCELKACPIPAPQPSGTYAGWRGYSLDSIEVDGTEYEAAQPGKYWTESQCPKLGNSFSTTLHGCARSCTRNLKCTAIHYSSGKYCELRNCPISAPQPSGTNAGWRAYSLD